MCIDMSSRTKVYLTETSSNILLNMLNEYLGLYWASKLPIIFLIVRLKSVQHAMSGHKRTDDDTADDLTVLVGKGRA